MLINLGLVFFTAFALGLSLYPVFIKISSRNKIIDKREARKIHLHEVPTMGGVPIFVAFLISIFIWLSYSDLQEYRYLISSLIFIFFLGLRDDFISLKPFTKLISQLVPSIVIFYLTDYKITSFYGLLITDSFPAYLSFIITISTILVITNAINLIDGLDGLAATISIIILVSFGIWFILIGDFAMGVLLFAMAGSIFAFIQYNWHPAKIFMGDTGALLLGFLLAIVTIKFININYTLSPDHLFRFNGSIATALAILIIPLFDTLRIFTIRLIKRKSPFKADKNHAHHTLFRLGLSHTQVVMVLGSINIMFIGLAVVFRNIGDSILVPAIILLGSIMSMVLEYLIIKDLLSKKNVNPVSIMEVIKSSRKVS